jgi:hypothetical protein
MTKIAIDESAWVTKGAINATPADEKMPAAVFVKDGTRYRFMLPGRSDIVEAFVVGGELELFEERSSAHKALRAVLDQLADTTDDTAGPSDG